jgi:predicted amidohydrolase YtcJ
MTTERYNPAATAMPVSGIRASENRQSPASLIVRNAKIYTGDPARPVASAAAISGGLFTAVGDDATIAPHVGVGTRVIDALGRRVIPGLNDSHLHVIRVGLSYLLELRWDGVPTLTMALEMLRVQAERTPPGQWVRVVGGWSTEQFPERRLPSISELNAAAGDTPVFVLHLYQCALLNRAALRAVGYDKHTPDPPGGQIVRNHAGEPTGMLIAAPSAALLYATLAKGPGLSPDDQLLSTRHFLRELNRFGLTSAIDAAGGFQNFPQDYGAVMSLAEQGQLTVRLAYHLFPQIAGQEIDDLRRWVGMVSPGDGDQWLRANGAGENLAWSAADFENFTEPRPALEPTVAAELGAAVRLLLDHGWGFRLHATYEETIQADLAVFERIAQDSGWPESTRWFFDHAETASQESLERISALGGGISVQNRMMFQGQAFVDRYGAARAETVPPVRAMLDTGLVVAAGTDATRVSSYNPWLSLAWLVTGRTLGGRCLYPESRRVDRATALAMYTAAGAQLSGEADVKGTISVGKYADLAILSADYFAVPEEEIGQIEALLTIAGGQVVYSACDYEDIAPPLPAMSPDWSPVARFCGYQNLPSGARQARSMAEAAAEATEHAAWRIRRGDLTAAHRSPGLADPLGGCIS